MVQKLMDLLGSMRFWILTLTGVLALLNGVAVIPAVQAWLLGVAALGTLDSVASRIGGAVDGSGVSVK